MMKNSVPSSRTLPEGIPSCLDEQGRNNCHRRKLCRGSKKTKKQFQKALCEHSRLSLLTETRANFFQEYRRLPWCIIGYHIIV